VDGGNSTTATPRVYCAVNLTQSDPEECKNLFTDKENLCTVSESVKESKDPELPTPVTLTDLEIKFQKIAVKGKGKEKSVYVQVSWIYEKYSVDVDKFDLEFSYNSMRLHRPVAKKTIYFPDSLRQTLKVGGKVNFTVVFCSPEAAIDVVNVVYISSVSTAGIHSPPDSSVLFTLRDKHCCPDVKHSIHGTDLCIDVHPDDCEPGDYDTTTGETDTNIDGSERRWKWKNLFLIVFCSVLIILGFPYTLWKLVGRNAVRRAVVLVSTGDSQSTYQDIANRIASQMNDCGKYDVYFSGWQTRSADSNRDSDIERLHEAIGGCSVALLISSPFGKSSYEELLARREASTWRDAFVIGSYALLTKKFPFNLNRKIFVAYAAGEGEDEEDFVHENFKRASNRRTYNLLKPSDRQALCKRLFGRSSKYANDDGEPLVGLESVVQADAVQTEL